MRYWGSTDFAARILLQGCVDVAGVSVIVEVLLAKIAMEMYRSFLVQVFLPFFAGLPSDFPLSGSCNKVK